MWIAFGNEFRQKGRIAWGDGQRRRGVRRLAATRPVTATVACTEAERGGEASASSPVHLVHRARSRPMIRKPAVGLQRSQNPAEQHLAEPCGSLRWNPVEPLAYSLALMTPTIRPARSPSARYECSTSACVFVHSPATWMLPGIEPGRFELIGIGAPQVEVRDGLTARWQTSARSDPLRAPPPGTRPRPPVRLLHSRPEARTDGGHQIPRLRAELARHRLDSGRGRLLNRAAPARMHGADGAAPAIGEQDRRAVRDAHADRARRIVADDGVGFGPVPPAGASAPHDGDVRAVDLADQAAAGRAPSPIRSATAVHSRSSARSSRSPAVKK